MTSLDNETINNISESFFRIINKLNDLFNKHPNTNNMTYFQHFKRAFCLSSKMCLGFVLLFIHSIFPFLFESSGSNIINNLYRDINERDKHNE